LKERKTFFKLSRLTGELWFQEQAAHSNFFT